MGLAGLLEVTAQSLTAVLGVWLGITVFTRSRTPQARTFSLVAFSLVAWSTAVIVQRLSTSIATVEVAHASRSWPRP